MITRTSRSCNSDLISSNSSYSDDGTTSGKCYHLYCYCCYCCSKCRIRRQQIDIEHLNINGSNDSTVHQTEGSATIRTTATTITETVVPPSFISLPTATFISTNGNNSSMPHSESTLTSPDHASSVSNCTNKETFNSNSNTCNSECNSMKKSKSTSLHSNNNSSNSNKCNTSGKTTASTAVATTTNMINCIYFKWPVQLFALVTLLTLLPSGNCFAAAATLHGNTVSVVANTATQLAAQYNSNNNFSSKPVTVSSPSSNSLLPQASPITSSSAMPSASSFDRTLSPRQIKTKYGFLRGILISVPSSFTSTSMSTTSSSSSPSSSANSIKEPAPAVTSASAASAATITTTTTTTTTTATAAAATTSTNGSSGGHIASYHQRQAQQQQSSKQSAHLSSSSVPTLEPVEAFLGVPYASPPLGSLRFMPPVTPSHWRGVRMANSLGPSCPQKLPKFPSNLSAGRMDYIKKMKQFTDHHSEDCLYLNLYAPLNRELNERLPVMFFITGESYDWGSGAAFDGTILASVGRVIVVTLNYRLGLFGFLPTSIEGTKRGNYALMDLIAALHWIHDNVGEFGGDSSNITLVGHDKGASLANLLMISPMARNLFARVVLMSGSALSPLTISTEADFFTQSLAKAVHCDGSTPGASSSASSSSQAASQASPSSGGHLNVASANPNGASDSNALLECLRSKSLDELIKVSYGIDETFKISFGPIVDGLLIPTDPRFLMESSNGSSNHLSYLHPMGLRSSSPSTISKPAHALLFGVTKTESPFIFTESEEKSGIDSLRRDKILYSFIKNIIDYYQEVILLSVINEYTDWSSLSESPLSRLDSLIDILSDGLIVSPIIKTGILHFRHQQRRMAELIHATRTKSPSHVSKTFFYVFDYQSQGSRYSKRLGCVHGEELAYLLGAPIASQFVTSLSPFASINYTKEEVTLSTRIIKYFANFASFGDPNGPNAKSTSSSSPFFSSAPSSNWNVSSNQLPHWPEFEEKNRAFLAVDIPPRVSSHYRTHRLSFWLNLIPKLQSSGKEESDHIKRHLKDVRSGLSIPSSLAASTSSSSSPSDVAFFERISLKFLDNLKPPPFDTGYNSNGISSDSPPKAQSTSSSSPSLHSNPSSQGHESSSVNKGGGGGGGGVSSHPDAANGGTSSKNTIILHPESDYSTALSLTIAIGMTLLILNVCVFTAVYYKLHSGKISTRHANNSNAGGNCARNRKGSLTSGVNVSNCGGTNYTTSTIERNRKGSISSSRSPGHSHSSLTTSSRHLAGQSQQLLAHTPTGTLVSHHGHHSRHSHSHSYHLYSGAPTDDTGDEYDSDGGFINDALRHGAGGGGNNEYTMQSVAQITGQQQAKSQSNQPSVTFSEYVTQHTLPHSSDVTSSTSSSTMTGHVTHHPQSQGNSYSGHSGHSMHPTTTTTTYFTSDHGQAVAVVGSNGVTTNGTLIGVSDVTGSLIYRPIYADTSDVSDGGQGGGGGCCPPVDPSHSTVNHGAAMYHSHHQGTQQSLQSLSHPLSAISSGHQQQQPGQPGHALYHHNGGHPGGLGNLHHSLQVSGGLLLAPCSSSSPISSSSLCSSSMSPGISSVGGGSSSVNGVNGGGTNASHNCSRVTSITGDLIGTGTNPGTCQPLKSGLNTSNATTTSSTTTTTSVDGKNCSLTVIQELEDEGHL